MTSKSNKKYISIFILILSVSLILIVFFFFLHLNSTEKFNRTDRFFRSSDSSSDCTVSIEQKGSWPKEDSLISGVNNGYQYDLTVGNLSKYEVSDWTLKINFDDDCYLNQAWNGTVEVHQLTGTPKEKVQTLDLHNFDFDFNDVTLEYVGSDKNNLMVHLYPGDSIIYMPTSDNNFKEKTLNPFNGAPGSTTIGLIFYSTMIPELSDFELVYHYKKSLFQGTEFYILFGASVFWVLLLVIFSVSIIVRRRAEHELREREAMLEETLDLISHFVDAKDPYTNGHSERVSTYACKLAERLGFSARNARYVYYAAILHDVGKSYVPDEILKKPDKLTEKEYETIKNHTVYGYEMLKSIKSIIGIADGAYYHHEYYDGSGYPTGKSGLDIPYIARIICVADSFDAMNSSRCYRKPLSREVIINELNKNRGKQFDPAIVDAMLGLIESGEIVFFAETDGKPESGSKPELM